LLFTSEFHHTQSIAHCGNVKGGKFAVQNIGKMEFSVFFPLQCFLIPTLRFAQTDFGNRHPSQIPAARPATLARPRRAESCPNRAIHQFVQRASSQPGHLVGDNPLSVEYANLHRMYPAAIHIKQFNNEKVHAIQSHTDAHRQIAVHSPAPAEAPIDLFTKTNIAVDNLHRQLLFSRPQISIRSRKRNVTIHAHIEPIARSNLHCGLDIQILPRHLHAQLPKLLAKGLSCSRARRHYTGR
jgi:hypothetical protein